MSDTSLLPDDLVDLVHQIVSFDEFMPKLDQNNIVVQFQVNDNFDAAYDLSSFIEKCCPAALDTEAQEVPNRDGRFNVFVEFERSPEFIDNFEAMIQNIQNLTGKVKWKAQIYRINDPVDYTPEALSALTLVSEEQLREFFEYAPLSGVKLDEKHIVLNINGSDYTFSCDSGFVTEPKVRSLLESACEYDYVPLENALSMTPYTVVHTENGFLLGCNYNDNFLLLK